MDESLRARVAEKYSGEKHMIIYRDNKNIDWAYRGSEQGMLESIEDMKGRTGKDGTLNFKILAYYEGINSRGIGAVAATVARVKKGKNVHLLKILDGF